MPEEMGIDLEKLIDAAKLFEKIMEKELYGFVSKAGPVKALWGAAENIWIILSRSSGTRILRCPKKATACLEWRIKNPPSGMGF
jgi:hypothetical protein